MCSIFCCYIVPQSEVGVVETCGKYSHIATPGCNCMWPWSLVIHRLTTRLCEYTTPIESKTKDNVFVQLSLVLQYQYIIPNIKDAYYGAINPLRVMEDHVLNSIRAKIPLYKLEALYVERGTISQQLKDEIDVIMARYGIEIISALIADINPGNAINSAMNEVQRLQRLRVAVVDQAQTDKLKRVRAAEANCDARRLAGEGVAEQRKAIIAGLMQSIEGVQDEVPGLTSEDATNMLLMTQYFDTLQDVASKSKSTTMLMETTGGLNKLASQLKGGIMHMMR